VPGNRQTLDVLVIGDQLDVHNLLVGISDSSHGLTAMADRSASRKSSWPRRR